MTPTDPVRVCCKWLTLIMTTLFSMTGVSAGAATASTDSNPLLAEWSGPYGGVPPFDKVKPESLKPALEAGMKEALADLNKIANDPAAPNFDNTIAAMERAGRLLDRTTTIYGIYSSTMDTEPVQAVEREMEPKLAAFRDQVTQNEKLFKRIAAVYDTRESSNLTPEQQRLTWLRYTDFVRAGAKLDATAKKRLSEINQQLATLFTTFSQNLLADENDRFVLLDNETDLAGLPDAVKAGAAAAAEERGKKGKWLIANTRSSVE